MKDTKLLNDEIQLMLSNQEGIKNFYRFVAQNPHITLHDACQIIINRANASICFSFEEWNAMSRRIIQNRKGIPYYDLDGNKRFVFDVNDTYGSVRYQRLINPIKQLLKGIDILNSTNILAEDITDYQKIFLGVEKYLLNDKFQVKDEKRNNFIAQGISYLLYCKTVFPKNKEIILQGLPYSLKENALLVKEIYEQANVLSSVIEKAHLQFLNEESPLEEINVSNENAIFEEKNTTKTSIKITEEKQEVENNKDEQSQEIKPISIDIKNTQKKKQKVVTLFDFMGDSEENLEEQFITSQLKRGSGFADGKLRIYGE